MTTKLIKLNDGTLVEVDAKPDESQMISSNIADKVDSSIGKIQPLLVKACTPVVAAWKELSSLTNIEQAEIELGLTFEGEGNIYIAKGKVGANLTVKLTLKSTT